MKGIFFVRKPMAELVLLPRLLALYNESVCRRGVCCSVGIANLHSGVVGQCLHRKR